MFDSAETLIPLVLHTVAWCLFAMWILLDPFLYLAVDMLFIDLRLRPQSPFGDRGFHAFHRVGWRLLLLPTLAIVAVGSATFLSVSQLTRGVTPLVHILPCWIIITFCWLMLLGFHSTWYRYGMLLRVRFVVRTARRIAAQLNEHWPTADGTLPWVGEYRIDSDTPDMLGVCESHSRFPVWEPCGPFIRHDPSGIVRFDLASRSDINLSLEVFFNGEAPRSYVDVFDGFSIKRDLEGSIRLRHNVFLTWYESDFADVTDKGAESLCDVMGKMCAEMAKHGGGACCAPREQIGT